MTKKEFIEQFNKRKTSVYHLPYFDRWTNMNRICDLAGKSNPKSTCAKKGIIVFEPWRRYRRDVFDYKRINHQNYQNYVRFITKLIEKAREFDKNEYKNIRIERIDKDGDFAPANLHIIDLDANTVFDPVPTEVVECLK